MKLFKLMIATLLLCAQFNVTFANDKAPSGDLAEKCHNPEDCCDNNDDTNGANPKAGQGQGTKTGEQSGGDGSTR